MRDGRAACRRRSCGSASSRPNGSSSSASRLQIEADASNGERSGTSARNDLYPCVFWWVVGGQNPRGGTMDRRLSNRSAALLLAAITSALALATVASAAVIKGN